MGYEYIVAGNLYRHPGCKSLAAQTMPAREHQVRSTGKRRYPVVVLVAHRPADSLRKPQDTREDRVYAATVCMRAGRYQIYEQLVVICRMNRTLYRWTREARVKLESWGEKVAARPACHADGKED